MIYETQIAKGELPPFSSPVGRLCYFYLKMQADIEYFGTRAIVQAVTNPKEITPVFNAYFEAQYPYMKDITENRDKKVADTLKRELKKGPLKVTPLPDLNKRLRAARMYKRGAGWKSPS
jgi:hypothetical protein